VDNPGRLFQFPGGFRLSYRPGQTGPRAATALLSVTVLLSLTAAVMRETVCPPPDFAVRGSFYVDIKLVMTGGAACDKIIKCVGKIRLFPEKQRKSSYKVTQIFYFCDKSRG